MTYDTVIVGGGIVGLATAFRLLEARPQLKILLLEKEAKLAAHQTGNNSGVLHSGLYYKPGSEKARLSVSGLQQIIAFCREHGIEVKLGYANSLTLDQIEALAEVARNFTDTEA